MPIRGYGPETGLFIMHPRKKGDRKEWANYWGMFLLNLSGKVCTKCLGNDAGK